MTPERGFWNQRRRLVYARTAVWTVFFGLIAITVVVAAIAENESRHYGGDFAVYHSAGGLALEGSAEGAYDLRTIHARERDLFPQIEIYPWHYPPQFFVFISPLAALPYPLALALWLSLTGAAYLWVAWVTVDRRLTLSVAICGPAILANLAFGQNGMLTAAVAGAGMLLLPSRPALGGAIIGLLSYKPHLAVFPLVSLLIAHQGRALAGALLAISALAGVATLVAGPDSWPAYRADTDEAARFLRYAAQSWADMPTWYSFARSAGLTFWPAQAGQWLASGITVGLLSLVWRSPAPFSVKAASTLVSMLTGSPYAFVYDLTLSSLAVGWLLRTPASRDRRTTLLLATVVLLPQAAPVTHALVGLQLAPIVLMTLLAVLSVPSRDLRSINRVRASPPAAARVTTP